MNSDAIQIKEKDLENIARNLQYLISHQQLSANQISEKLGLPLVTLRRLMLGDTTDPRISTLKSIAEYFNVSLDTLVTGDVREQIAVHPQIKPQFIPILTWEKIESISSLKELDLKNWGNWLPVTIDSSQSLSPNAFAIESRPSMYPRFATGTLFIIDPALAVKDSDLVLIRLLDSGEITMKEIVIDPPEWKLMPIVPSSESILFDRNKHSIIGIVLLTQLFNRKPQNG